MSQTIPKIKPGGLKEDLFNSWYQVSSAAFEDASPPTISAIKTYIKTENLEDKIKSLSLSEKSSNRRSNIFYEGWAFRSSFNKNIEANKYSTYDKNPNCVVFTHGDIIIVLYFYISFNLTFFNNNWAYRITCTKWAYYSFLSFC